MWEYKSLAGSMYEAKRSVSHFALLCGRWAGSQHGTEEVGSKLEITTCPLGTWLRNA